MATVQTSPPAVEPLSLADAKAHLRIDTTAEDTLIQSLIMTARLHIEVALGLALISQSWSCFFDQWPPTPGTRNAPAQPVGAAFTLPNASAWFANTADVITLPLSPVKSVDAIRVYADDGTFLALPPSGFSFDFASRHPRIVRRPGTRTPDPGRRLNGIEIAVTAGFGTTPADIPAPIRQALLLLVAHWYEHRDPGEIGTPEARIPGAVSHLLMPWLPVRL